MNKRGWIILLVICVFVFALTYYFLSKNEGLIENKEIEKKSPLPMEITQEDWESSKNMLNYLRV